MSIGKLLNQEVSESQKRKSTWYQSNFEYYHGVCQADNHISIQRYYDMLINGLNIDDYKYVLNPYNSPDKRFSELPGNIRNIDIITPIWERYVGEYISQYDNFVITNVDPRVVEIRDARVLAKVNMLVSELFAVQMQQKMAEFNQQREAAIQQGNEAAAQQPPPEIKEIDFVKFVNDAKDEWGREQTKRNKQMLQLINNITDAEEKYIEGFFHWFISGRVISFHDVRHQDVHKEIIHPLEFKRYGSSRYIEDDIAGLRTFKLSIEEILSQFKDDIPKAKLEEIRKAVDRYGSDTGLVMPLIYVRDNFGADINVAGRADNTLTFSTTEGVLVDHLIWLSKTLYYELNIEEQMLASGEMIFTEEEYKLVKDIVPKENFTKRWVEEYWEQYRFGPDDLDIYTMPRPLRVQEADIKQSLGVKSPYNGLYGDIQGIDGSKYKRLIDFQALTNVFFLQLDRTIAKNMDKVLLIPESLLTESEEYTVDARLYYMRADNKLIVNDTDLEPGVLGSLASYVKILDGSLNQYISEMVNLIDFIKRQAWDQVAMNEQRFGDINSNAGKAVTEQTIFRTSLGSRLTFDAYNKFVARDHEKALNYSRIAYVEGETKVLQDGDEVAFISLGGANQILSDLGVKPKYSATEKENINAAKQGAFSIFQNDKPELAVEVLKANSMDEVADAMKEYTKITQEYQAATQAAEKATEEAKTQGKLAEINTKGEWDYKIEELRQDNENARKQVDADIELLSSVTNSVEVTDSNNVDPNKERELSLKTRIQDDLVSFRDKQLQQKDREIDIKAKQAKAQASNKAKAN